MICKQVDGLIIYQFENLSGYGVPHGIFTRRGGVSSAPYRGLNFGYKVGDQYDNVRQNHELALSALGREGEFLYDVNQSHGAQAILAQADFLNRDKLHADAIVAHDTRLTLLMRYADCVPILLFDPIHKSVGIIHAGWRGTVLRVVESAINLFKDTYGSDPGDLVVGIGPAICETHYPIGSDVAQAFSMEFRDDARFFLSGVDGHYFLDLVAANVWILSMAGVRSIEVSGFCTACNPEDWFSHRKENGLTGRFGVMIGGPEGVEK